jgi:D-lactate dehydrogenase (cytochrome)
VPRFFTTHCSATTGRMRRGQHLVQPIRLALAQLRRRGADDGSLRSSRQVGRIWSSAHLSTTSSGNAAFATPPPSSRSPRRDEDKRWSDFFFTTQSIAGFLLGCIVVGSLGELYGGDLQKTWKDQPTPSSRRPDLKRYVDSLRTEAGFREDQISIDDTDLESHGHSEWSYHPSRKPSAVVYPESVEQVQAIVLNAHKNGIVLLPFAGGTSLEAHWSAPSDRPGGKERIAVSVDVGLMDKIGVCNVEDGDIEVEAGVRYEDLNEHLHQEGIPLFFPVDPGPGAALGGMMGTGGSGTNAVRYGTMKGDYILNATVVLPSGKVIVTKSRVRKSSVGPDLTKLFLGSEGTLGIICKVTLRLATVLPTSILVVPFPSIGQACAAAQRIVGSGIAVQCIELLDDEMIKVINKANAKTHGGDQGKYKELIEKTSLFIKLQGGESHRREDERSIRALSTRKEFGVINKEIKASHDEVQNEELWRARKIALWSCQQAMPERPDGGKWLVWTTDVSVPLGSMATLFDRVRKDTIKTGLNAPIVGHIGDGGAHSIIVFKDGDDKELQRVKAFVHRIVGYAHDLGGTCTSEHGVGRGKRMYLKKELGASIDLLRTLKASIDPDHIMNPGALLYEDDREEEEEREELERYH